MHVLSTPPAFVLSQDQTLRRCLNRLRPRADTRVNQPKESQPGHKPWHGVLLGTDFRHAVEFSKSGRTETRPFRASSLAGCPTLRRFPVFPHPGPGPADLPVRAAQREHYTISEALAQGPSSGLRVPFVAPPAGPVRDSSATRGGLRDFPGAVPAGSHGRRAGRSAAGTVSATGRRGPAFPAVPVRDPGSSRCLR